MLISFDSTVNSSPNISHWLIFNIKCPPQKKKHRVANSSPVDIEANNPTTEILEILYCSLEAQERRTISKGDNGAEYLSNIWQVPFTGFCRFQVIENFVHGVWFLKGLQCEKYLKSILDWNLLVISIKQLMQEETVRRTTTSAYLRE